MKIKIYYLLAICLSLAIIFAACDKQYDNVIENSNPDYQVIRISLEDSLEYPVNSNQTVQLTINFDSQIKNVFFDIYSPSGSKINNSFVPMLDNGQTSNGDSVAGDGIFSTILSFDSTDLSGTYNLNFSILDIYNNTKQVAAARFYYNNGQGVFAPVISNLILADSVQRGLEFTFSVDVTDSNGQNDLASVFYELFTPAGVKIVNSQGISKFPLFDDGNTTSNGDLTSNDGTFTVKLTFPNTVEIGFWRFEFSAIDLENKLSNKIIKQVTVL